jgi:MtN3 and saliva related transmembrane protein
MELNAVFGGLATAASTASFVPQAWKIIKTRETIGISVYTYGITVAGFALWLTYGIMLGRWPLMLTNGICLLLSAFIFMMKLLSPHARDAVADTLDVSADQP